MEVQLVQATRSHIANDDLNAGLQTSHRLNRISDRNPLVAKTEGWPEVHSAAGQQKWQARKREQEEDGSKSLKAKHRGHCSGGALAGSKGGRPARPWADSKSDNRWDR